MDNKDLIARAEAYATPTRYNTADAPIHELVRGLANALEAAEAELTDLRANPRDEYHTMDELYDYRMLYNALAFNAWAAARTLPVVKSWRHSDGELCFGGGWFIVTATLPTGLVSNHYKAEHWDLFQVDDVWYPPEYDGHTPRDAAERLRSVAAAPVSLEAVTAETTTEWGVSHMEGHERAYELSPDRESAEAELRSLNQGYGWPGENQLVTREVTGWRPVKPEEADRG